MAETTTPTARRTSRTQAAIGHRSGNSEQDPAPMKSTFRLVGLRAIKSCRLAVSVEVLPDLKPLRLFPFGKVEVSVRGTSGKGRRYRKTRHLPLGDSAGYVFHLKP